MSEQEILDGNKLIAEFMGAVIEQDYCEIKGMQDGLGFYFKKDDAPSVTLRYSSIGLKYHSSWDWLMPVIKKINEVDEFDMFWEVNNIDKYNLIVALSKVDIIYTFELCVEFIKWYNKNEINKTKL